MPHAYIVMTPDNVGVLVHLGLDTVALKGEGFTTHVSQGDDVTAGQLVITYDVPAIVAKGLNPDCSRRGHGRTRTGQRRSVRRGHRGRGYRLRRRPFHCEQVRWKSSSWQDAKEIGGVAADAIGALLEPQADRGAGPGHRLVAAGDLRRTGGALRRRARSRSGRPAASPSTSTSACPPTIPSATGPSSTRCSCPGSTSRPARSQGPDGLAADIPAACAAYENAIQRGGRRRPADPRDRHRRAHRVQRARVLAGVAHPDQDADQADPDRQRPLLRRRRRRGAHPLPDPGPGDHHGRPARDPGGDRPQQGRSRAPAGRGCRSARCGRRPSCSTTRTSRCCSTTPRPAGCSSSTTTARPIGPSRNGRASECC